jgi:hypothetical protein
MAGHRLRRLDVGQAGLVLADPRHKHHLVVVDDGVAGRRDVALHMLTQGNDVLDVVRKQRQPVV